MNDDDWKNWKIDVGQPLNGTFAIGNGATVAVGMKFVVSLSNGIEKYNINIASPDKDYPGLTVEERQEKVREYIASWLKSLGDVSLFFKTGGNLYDAMKK
jgi:hypothetical protein